MTIIECNFLKILYKFFSQSLYKLKRKASQPRSFSFDKGILNGYYDFGTNTLSTTCITPLLWFTSAIVTKDLPPDVSII